MRYPKIIFLLIQPINSIAEVVEFEAKVLRVIDGDSIIVKNEDGKYPIRIKYVDAPEIQQNMARKAKIFLVN